MANGRVALATHLWYPRGVTAPRSSHARFACDLAAEIATDRGTATGPVVDINESAMCMLASSAIEPGTQVQVQLRLVLEWGTSEPLVVPAVVLWETPTQGQHQLGLGFATLAPDTTQRLDVLLKVMCGQISLPGRS